MKKTMHKTIILALGIVAGLIAGPALANSPPSEWIKSLQDQFPLQRCGAGNKFYHVHTSYLNTVFHRTVRHCGERHSAPRSLVH